MNMRRCLVYLLCGLVTACTFIPKHQQPALPVEDQWDTRALSPEGQVAFAAIGWQDFFQTQPMKDLIEAALAHNRDLRVAALQVEAARALYRIDRADLLPHVDARVSGYHQRSPEAANVEGVGSTRYTEYSANVATTNFELDVFGYIRSRNQAALESYFATKAAQDVVATALIAEVANAYLQWLTDRKIFELSRQTLDAQEKTFELIRERYESGITSKLELAQVRTSAEAARANVALYSRRIALDRNALRLLIGETCPLPENQTLDQVRVMTHLPVGLPSEVLLLRPEVRRAEHILRESNANIGAARAAFFPRIALTGSLGFASDAFGELFSSSAAGAWTFVPTITVPIFQAGRNKANLEYAELRKEIAIAQYEKAIQVAFREVSDQLDTRAALEEEYQAQQAQVASAREAYELSLARYKGGVDSFLSALDAQRFLFQAQIREIEIERLRLANVVNLYKALGGGLH
ncbi:MAG: efflux transporter outer membrane subunit [Acidobacteria bacterium]|nr:efflux transporter outer membrane subunit [Acidobacteriota bacterium]